MTERTITADERSLPPWKAALGFLFCLGLAIYLYRNNQFAPACSISGVAGMFVQDWVYRLRDRYDPRREIGND